MCYLIFHTIRNTTNGELRLKGVNRQQRILRAVGREQLIEPDDAAPAAAALPSVAASAAGFSRIRGPSAPVLEVTCEGSANVPEIG